MMSLFCFLFFGLISLHFVQFIACSYCGESAIPFSFEVLPEGHFVLGCARPNCFGWDQFGRPVRANDSNFYRVNKQPDGFFRKALASNTPKPLSDADAAWFSPQTATCMAGYKQGRCAAGTAAGDHWVGGIAPSLDQRIAETSPLLLRCCRWQGLTQSADRGIAAVGPGQIVYGGEVLNGERQYAFDYVSDVVRVDQGEKRYLYEVSIYRMACLPRPERLSIVVEAGVFKEMMAKFMLANAHPSEKDDFGAGEEEEQTPQRHTGESRVIKTSKLESNSPVNNSEKPGASEEQENPLQAKHVHLGSERTSKNKAFAAAIQGPFAENEVDNVPSLQDDEQIGHQEWSQLDRDMPHGELEQQPAGPRPKGGATRQRLICDRNMTTRARRQAGCEEVEIEAPPGTELQVQEAGGQGQGQQGWWQSYPATGGGGGGSSIPLCFAGDTRVRVANGGQRRMDQLEVGDWVFSANRSQLVYSVVESWIHRVLLKGHRGGGDNVQSKRCFVPIFPVPGREAEFVRIQLEDGRQLKLTDEHFIYKRSNCLLLDGGPSSRPVPMERLYELAELTFARDVRPGDCVFAQPAENPELALLFEQLVIKVDRVREQGIYAPMTSTGDILVEGILASCFAVEPSAVLQKSVFHSLLMHHGQSLMDVDASLGHSHQQLQMELPGWLHFFLDHLLPVVLPK